MSKITKSSQTKLTETLTSIFTTDDALSYGKSAEYKGEYVFRRVGRISMFEPKMQKITCPEDTPQPVDSLCGYSDEVTKKNIQTDCSSFYGKTTSRAMRAEPYWIVNRPIHFNSNSFKEPQFPGVPSSSKVTTPMDGDLLCLYVVPANRHEPEIHAAHWFIASEQYIQAYTAILYPWHETFDKLIPQKTNKEFRDIALVKKLFSGNTLMTNTWLKTKLAAEQSGKVFSLEESRKTYWHLRSETASRMWVDVWAAFVLLARYGEVPNHMNVPNTIGCSTNQPLKRKSRNLPVGFLEALDLEYEEVPKMDQQAFDALFKQPSINIKINFENNSDCNTSCNNALHIEIRSEIKSPPKKKRFFQIALEADWVNDTD